MLLDGLNHVAVLTADTDRLHAFYQEVFESTVPYDQRLPGFRFSIATLGTVGEFNVFELDDNAEASRQTPMFGRGRLDHLGLQASSVESFDELRRRLTDRGASDGFVTDFGPVLSLFFRDPDGLEAEVCVKNPAAVPGRLNPPGTPAPGYS